VLSQTQRIVTAILRHRNTLTCLLTRREKSWKAGANKQIVAIFLAACMFWPLRIVTVNCCANW